LRVADCEGDLSHVLGRDHVGHKVALRCKSVHKVVDLFPILQSLTGVGLAALPLDFDATAGVQHATALGSECEVQLLVGKVGLSFQVQGMLLAGAAYVAHGGLGDDGLLDVGGKVIDAGLAGALSCSGDTIGLHAHPLSLLCAI
jgi:hypothetical protein